MRFEITLEILSAAIFKFSSEVAYDNRMQFGTPNAAPETVDTWPCINKYMHKSSALEIKSPSGVRFPNNLDTSGNK
jgi:hypothetical protein